MVPPWLIQVPLAHPLNQRKMSGLPLDNPLCPSPRVFGAKSIIVLLPRKHAKSHQLVTSHTGYPGRPLKRRLKLF